MPKASEEPLHEQDLGLYLSLRNIPDRQVTAGALRNAVQELASIDLDGDQRLSNFRSALDEIPAREVIPPRDFEKLIREGGRLVRRALRGELVVPDFHVFKARVTQIFDEISRIDPVGAEPAAPQNPPRLAVFDGTHTSARNADYIPSLSKANDGWGVAICTVDGQMLSLGDHDVRFSIQSCCKPINPDYA